MQRLCGTKDQSKDITRVVAAGKRDEVGQHKMRREGIHTRKTGQIL